MAITSKEWIIVLLGIIGSALLGLLITSINFEINQFKDSITTIIIIIISAGIIIAIIYKKINEINEELNNQKNEQKKLDEKFKIYERLSKIEKKIGI